MLNLYSFLKIPKESTQEEVEAAQLKFRERINSFAPGVQISDEEIEKNFPEVSQGFNVLRDPVRRAEYDGLLLKSTSASVSDEVQTEPEQPEEILTFRQWINRAATYVAFFSLVVLVIFFLYMLAGYKL